jgi:malate dehydrogenase (oxaloacetate-decarboxylating)
MIISNTHINTNLSQSGQQRPLYLSYAGPMLLDTPLLNKGSAFPAEERLIFNLEGLLPDAIESIEDQATRAYSQYIACATAVDKHIFLRDIQDNNETLFYHLLRSHLEEMMPIIYTPTVGQACQEFSRIYRKPRGLFVSYPNRHHIDDMLQNAIRRKVKVMVVTDGERILGLGDQGIGGMGIPIGKLSLYTACGGISPAYALPVVLDAGTNNPQLLADPMYMGWRHPRLKGSQYDELVDLFIQAVKRRWPEALVQFEDFAQHNATPILERYRNQICCFNDDIQGTASVCLATLLAAGQAGHYDMKNAKIVFVGAGSAGCGIAEQVVSWFKSQGLSDHEARKRVWMIDRLGLMVDDMPNLLPFQKRLAHSRNDLWENAPEAPQLLEVIEAIKPNILIGVSGQPNLFTEQVIRTLTKHCAQPTVLVLSNPTSKAEATPEQIIQWSNGQAIVATGSPFDPVYFNGKTYHIAQCNNSYIFPGLGLGVIASKANHVSDGMLMAASQKLAQLSPLASKGYGPLLPPLRDLPMVSREIAIAVAKTAHQEGHTGPMNEETLMTSIQHSFWDANYRPYRRIPIPF